MARPRSAEVYRRFTGAFGVTVAALGVAMIALTVGRGGGPLSVGVVLGALFVALGILRLYLLRKGP